MYLSFVSRVAVKQAALGKKISTQIRLATAVFNVLSNTHEKKCENHDCTVELLCSSERLVFFLRYKGQKNSISIVKHRGLGCPHACTFWEYHKSKYLTLLFNTLASILIVSATVNNSHSDSEVEPFEIQIIEIIYIQVANNSLYWSYSHEMSSWNYVAQEASREHYIVIKWDFLSSISNCCASLHKVADLTPMLNYCSSCI